MKNVYFITNQLSGGGAERVMTVIANYLINQRFNVSFIVLHGDDSSEYSLDARIKIHSFNFRHNIVKQIKTIRKFMKSDNNSTFISFFTHQNLYTIIAAIGLKNKVIVSERNDPSKSINGIIKKIIRRILYASNSCHTIVFQTEDAMNYFSKKIQKKGIVIPNPLKENLPLPFTGKREKCIVSFGRFEQQKNYSLLIRAFNIFLKGHDDYKLILYGRGTMKNSLKELASELKINDKVFFNDFNDDIHNIILKAGMFVLPSNYEGLSNSMLEAMAIGLPVICTDCPCGGARMFIKNKKNGILFPVDNLEKLVDALNFIADNPKVGSDMGLNASIIRNELKPSSVCKKWISIIN